MKALKQIRATIKDGIVSEGEDGFAAQLATQNTLFHLIFSWGENWEHVSISVIGEKRCPTWDEMCFIKSVLWQDNECVIQYHPAKTDYINCHPYVLHLWRPQNIKIPMPPKSFV